MSAEQQELRTIIKELLPYIGYASCSGNKCRLPHCHDCCVGAEEACERLDEILTRARHEASFAPG